MNMFCETHGLTEFWPDDFKYGGKRNTCIACDRKRRSVLDALDIRASLRLGLGRSTGGKSKWKTLLTTQQRKAERDIQRQLDQEGYVSEEDGATALLPSRFIDDLPKTSTGMRQTTDPRGFVYVGYFRSAWEGWLVTGRAVSTARIRSYDTYSPYRDFVVIARVATNDRKAAEGWLQGLFEAKHIRSSEWFKMSHDDARQLLSECWQECPGAVEYLEEPAK